MEVRGQFAGVDFFPPHVHPGDKTQDRFYSKYLHLLVHLTVPSVQLYVSSGNPSSGLFVCALVVYPWNHPLAPKSIFSEDRIKR